MKVYLAGRFPRLEELNGYRERLEPLGIEVTSRWLRGGHEWSGTPDEDISPADLVRFAREDLEDIDRADMVAAFTEPARSGPARGGRHVEAGYAIARGKPLLVIGDRENVFYTLPQVRVAPDFESARIFLGTLMLCTAAGSFGRKSPDPFSWPRLSGRYNVQTGDGRPV